jgi:hypothetical protein
MRFILAFLAVLVLPALALAQAVVPDPTVDLAAYIQMLGSLWGKWTGLVALLVLGLVYAGRKWGSMLWPWLGTKLGVIVTNAVVSVVGTIAAYLISGAPWSWNVLLEALGAAFTAAGVFSLTKNTKEALGPKAVGAAAVLGVIACLTMPVPASAEVFRLLPDSPKTLTITCNAGGTAKVTATGGYYEIVVTGEQSAVCYTTACATGGMNRNQGNHGVSLIPVGDVSCRATIGVVQLVWAELIR